MFRETNEVFGHIIGSDPLGHAYVVPLTHVLEQIETCFGVDAKLTAATADELATMMEPTEGSVVVDPPLLSSEGLMDDGNESPKARDGRRQRWQVCASEEEDSIIWQNPRSEKHYKPYPDHESEVPVDIDRRGPSGVTHNIEERDIESLAFSKPSAFQAPEALSGTKGKAKPTVDDGAEQQAQEGVVGYLFPGNPRYDGEHSVVRSRSCYKRYFIGRQPECGT